MKKHSLYDILEHLYNHHHSISLDITLLTKTMLPMLKSQTNYGFHNLFLKYPPCTQSKSDYFNGK